MNAPSPLDPKDSGEAALPRTVADPDPDEEMVRYNPRGIKGEMVLVAGIGSLICAGAATGPAAFLAGLMMSAQASAFSTALGCLFCLGLFLGPITWGTGSRLLSEIDSTQTQLPERKLVAAGRRCAMVATVLSAIAAIGLVSATIYDLSTSMM